ALEALAHDLHVQEPEEAAPESEAQRARSLGLVGERRVVQPESLERFPEVGVLVAVDRVEPAEHHGLRLAIAGQRTAAARRTGHWFADLRFANVLDARDEIADLAGSEGGDGREGGQPYADLLGVVVLLRVDVSQPRAAPQHTVEYAH